jgi:hypothetical protein
MEDYDYNQRRHSGEAGLNLVCSAGQDLLSQVLAVFSQGARVNC